MRGIRTVPILSGAAHFDAPHGVVAWPPEPDDIYFGKRFVLMKRWDSHPVSRNPQRVRSMGGAGLTPP